jgi:hypothetical protein
LRARVEEVVRAGASFVGGGEGVSKLKQSTLSLQHKIQSLEEEKQHLLINLERYVFLSVF